jgi:hypothetical protein
MSVQNTPIMTFIFLTDTEQSKVSVLIGSEKTTLLSIENNTNKLNIPYQVVPTRMEQMQEVKATTTPKATNE